MSGSIGRDESYLTRREAGKHFTIFLHKRREGEAKDTTNYGLVSVNLTAVCVYTQKKANSTQHLRIRASATGVPSRDAD